MSTAGLILILILIQWRCVTVLWLRLLFFSLICLWFLVFVARIIVRALLVFQSVEAPWCGFGSLWRRTSL